MGNAGLMTRIGKRFFIFLFQIKDTYLWITPVFSIIICILVFYTIVFVIDIYKEFIVLVYCCVKTLSYIVKHSAMVLSLPFVFAGLHIYRS